jgi:hypothetical protein
MRALPDTNGGRQIISTRPFVVGERRSGVSFTAAVEHASAKLQARRSAVALPQCSPLRTYFRLKYSQYGCSAARCIFAPAFAATVESALGSRENRSIHGRVNRCHTIDQATLRTSVSC